MSTVQYGNFFWQLLYEDHKLQLFLTHRSSGYTYLFVLQEEYYATHQCFLTRRSLYLLLWNITEGVDGLIGLRPWLENIEGRAPKSPVIVVGTHLDKVPPVDRVSLMATLQAEFEELYLRNTHRKYTYPRIHEQCQFISVNSTRNIDYVRDYIYEFALQYKVPGESD